MTQYKNKIHNAGSFLNLDLKDEGGISAGKLFQIGTLIEKDIGDKLGG